MKINHCVNGAILLGSVVMTGHLTAVKAKESKPNFLFIITDDQDFDTLGVYGDTECDTPNLDRLAKEGMALTGAHQMGSFIGGVSVASRTMIMTGRNVWNAQQLRIDQRVYDAYDGNADLAEPTSPEYYSLPALFHRAGYDTFRTCKAGNSYEAANALFDTRYDRTNRDGNDENGSKWHSDHVISYLNDRVNCDCDKEDKKPFFIYLGFSHPHDARHGRPELLEKYGAQDIAEPTEVNDKMPSLPKSWLPEKIFDNGHPNLRDETKVYGVMKRRDEATVRNELGKEYACIEYIDTEIGRVLRALEKSGELDNTYVIFTSDHGIAVGKHAYMGKQNLYEHSFRVPFIVKGPSIKKNSMSTGNVYLMDVLPTLCDLADIEGYSKFDGMSFKSVLEGDDDVIRETLYGVYSGGTKPGIRCVKSGDWKLVKYDILGGTVQKTQLFNLKDNPDELFIEHHAADVVAKTGNKPSKREVDLSSDPKYAYKLAQMEALLLEEMRSVGDPYRLWNQPQSEAAKK